MILPIFLNNKLYPSQKLFHIEKENIDLLLFQLIMDISLTMCILKEEKYTGGVHAEFPVKIRGVISIVTG